MTVTGMAAVRVRRITCVIVLAVAFTVTPPLWAQAAAVTPPAVPANIQVPAGSKAFLAAHAVGTQDYICRAHRHGLRLDVLRTASHLVHG